MRQHWRFYNDFVIDVHNKRSGVSHSVHRSGSTIENCKARKMELEDQDLDTLEKIKQRIDEIKIDKDIANQLKFEKLTEKYEEKCMAMLKATKLITEQEWSFNRTSQVIQ